jgi:dTDP-4-dehydrorhamnose reductase
MLEFCAGGRLVNFVGFTDVDPAERQRQLGCHDQAWKLNVDGAVHVAQACALHGIAHVHISTDFVFPGTEEVPGPYTETAHPADSHEDICWYGWTKRMGEVEVREQNPDAAIVRIGYPFRPDRYINRFGQPGKADAAHKILELHAAGKLYPQFSDQTISPTYIPDLTQALQAIFMQDAVRGVYHVTSPDTCSPYLFAQYLLRRIRGVDRVVNAGSIEDFMRDHRDFAHRPVHGGLDPAQTQHRLMMKFKPWELAIEDMAVRMGV